MQYLWRVKYLESLIIMNVKAKGYVLGVIAAATLRDESLVCSSPVRGGDESGFSSFFQVLVCYSGVGSDD